MVDNSHCIIDSCCHRSVLCSCFLNCIFLSFTAHCGLQCRPNPSSRMLHPINNNSNTDESLSKAKSSSKIPQSVNVCDRMEASGTKTASQQSGKDVLHHGEVPAGTSSCASPEKENTSPQADLNSLRGHASDAISEKSSLEKSIDPTHLALKLLSASKQNDQEPPKGVREGDKMGGVTDETTSERPASVPNSKDISNSSETSIPSTQEDSRDTHDSTKCTSPKGVVDSTKVRVTTTIKDSLKKIDPTNFALQLLARSTPDKDIAQDAPGTGADDVTGHDSMSKTATELTGQESSSKNKSPSMPIDKLDPPQITRPSDPETIVAQILASGGIGSGISNPAKTLSPQDERPSNTSTFPETDLATRLTANKAFIEKSRTIAENVVLGPSTSSKISEESSEDPQVGSSPSKRTDCDKAGGDLLSGNPINYLATASVVASRLLRKTGLTHIQEHQSSGFIKESSGDNSTGNESLVSENGDNEGTPELSQQHVDAAKSSEPPKEGKQPTYSSSGQGGDMLSKEVNKEISQPAQISVIDSFKVTATNTQAECGDQRESDNSQRQDTIVDDDKQPELRAVTTGEAGSESKTKESKEDNTTSTSKSVPTKEAESQGENGGSSILEVLRDIAGLAGTEMCVDGASSSTVPLSSISSIAESASVTTSEPSYTNQHVDRILTPNDHVPVASNISFDYSIANLIGNENTDLSTSYSRVGSNEESEQLPSATNTVVENQPANHPPAQKPDTGVHTSNASEASVRSSPVVNPPPPIDRISEAPAHSPHISNQAFSRVLTHPAVSIPSATIAASAVASSGSLPMTINSSLQSDCSRLASTSATVSLNSIPQRATTAQTFSAVTPSRTHTPAHSPNAPTSSQLPSYHSAVTASRPATNYNATETLRGFSSNTAGFTSIPTSRETSGYESVNYQSRNETSPPASGMISLSSLMNNANNLHQPTSNSGTLGERTAGFQPPHTAPSTISSNSFPEGLQYNQEQSRIPSSCPYPMPDMTLQEILGDAIGGIYEGHRAQYSNSASFMNTTGPQVHPSSAQSAYSMNVGSQMPLQNQSLNMQVPQWTSTVSNGNMMSMPAQQPPASGQVNPQINQYPTQRQAINMQQDMNQPNVNYQRQQTQNNSNMHHWRGPLGMGLQGREGYGQFLEFQVRPHNRPYVHNSHPNMPPNVSVTPSNVEHTGQQINRGHQDQLSAARDLQSADQSINMELTRFAMQDMQRQRMQASMNSVQLPPRTLRQQQPAQPHQPPHRGIPLVCLANQVSGSQARPSYTSNMQPNRPTYSQASQLPNSGLQNIRQPRPPRNTLPPQARSTTPFLARNTMRPPARNTMPPQVRNTMPPLVRNTLPPLVRSTMPPPVRPSSMTNLRQQLGTTVRTSQMNNTNPQPRLPRIPNPSVYPSSTSLPNILRPPMPRPQTAKRMPAPKPPQQPSNPPVIHHNVQNKPGPPQNSKDSAEKTQPSSKSFSVTPTSAASGTSDSSSLAALVVESVLRGHDHTHVEQQIRLVNELLMRKSPSKASDNSSQNAESSSAQQRTSTPPQANNQSRELQKSPTSSTPKVEKSNQETASTVQSSTAIKTSPPGQEAISTKKRSGRSRSNEPQYVDLTEDDDAIKTNTALSQLNKRPKRDFLDIHILIEVVNVKGHLSQFCLLERCLWGMCKPKHLSRCKLTHGWWVYQSEKRQPCPRNEDVAYIAAQIIARSQYDKSSFRQQMTTILNSVMGKRSAIFQTISTEKVHVIGRSFMRPRPEAGLLYINILKDIDTNTTTSEYLKVTASEAMQKEIKKLTSEEASSASDPKVVVIAPLTDTDPQVFAEPEQPVSIPARPLSAEERFNLENTAPIVIEPPPTPAPQEIYQDDDMQMRNPLIIAPIGPPTDQGILEPPSSIGMIPPTQVSVDSMLRQTPLVIAPPPTHRAAREAAVRAASVPVHGGHTPVSLATSQPTGAPLMGMPMTTQTRLSGPVLQPGLPFTHQVNGNAISQVQRTNPSLINLLSEQIQPGQYVSGRFPNIPAIPQQPRPEVQVANMQHFANITAISQQPRPESQVTSIPAIPQQPRPEARVAHIQQSPNIPAISPHPRPEAQVANFQQSPNIPAISQHPRPEARVANIQQSPNIPAIPQQPRPEVPVTNMQQFQNIPAIPQQPRPEVPVTNMQRFQNIPAIPQQPRPEVPVTNMQRFQNIPAIPQQPRPEARVHQHQMFHLNTNINALQQVINQQFQLQVTPQPVAVRPPLEPGVVPQPTLLQQEQPSQITFVANQHLTKPSDSGNNNPVPEKSKTNSTKQKKSQENTTPVCSDTSNPQNNEQQSSEQTEKEVMQPSSEYISLEDFMDLSCDPGRDKCSSVNSSIDGEKDAQSQHRVQDHLRALLFDHSSHLQVCSSNDINF